MAVSTSDRRDHFHSVPVPCRPRLLVLRPQVPLSRESYKRDITFEGADIPLPYPRSSNIPRFYVDLTGILKGVHAIIQSLLFLVAKIREWPLMSALCIRIASYLHLTILIDLPFHASHCPTILPSRYPIFPPITLLPQAAAEGTPNIVR